MQKGIGIQQRTTALGGSWEVCRERLTMWVGLVRGMRMYAYACSCCMLEYRQSFRHVIHVSTASTGLRQACAAVIVSDAHKMAPIKNNNTRILLRLPDPGQKDKQALKRRAEYLTRDGVLMLPQRCAAGRAAPSEPLRLRSCTSVTIKRVRRIISLFNSCSDVNRVYIQRRWPRDETFRDCCLRS